MRAIRSVLFLTTTSLVLWACAPQDSPAQAPAKNQGKDKSAPAAEPAAAASTTAKAFDVQLAEWKKVLKELREIKVKYQIAGEAEIPALQERWNQLIQQGEKQLPELRDAGRAAYLELPNADRQLLRFLVKLVEGDIARDDFEGAAELGNTLIDNACDQKEVYLYAGIAAFAVNDFERSTQYLQTAEESGLGSDLLKGASDMVQNLPRNYKRLIEDYSKYWTQEQELRKAETEKDDLPRVKLVTTKGDIVIELFENEAPETVGNFVSLVESGFYKGLTFHRVLAGFMAQGGCPKGDGSGSPGYEIYDEVKKENARKHFRGSLSMAKSARPDSGGSQFFLTFVPTPHLNGIHTVFGRVIEGMDVLAKLQRRNPDDKEKPEADKIISAEVLRKRDHAYAPNKVQ